MFRQLLQKVALFSILLGMIVTASGGQLKVATVDMTKLLNGFHEYQAAAAEERVDMEDLQKADGDRMAVMQGMVKELQKLQNEFNDPSLSPEKRKAIATDAKALETELARLKKDREDVLNRRRMELSEKMRKDIAAIRSKVIEAVNAHSSTLDVDYVFDESGLTTSGVPFLVYVRNRIDVTDAVLEKLNKNAPAPKAEKPGSEPSK